MCDVNSPITLHCVRSRWYFLCACDFNGAFQWHNAMFQNRRFRIEGSDSLHLHVLSLLCAWARHL